MSSFVAEWIECLLQNLEVVGSNPPSPKCLRDFVKVVTTSKYLFKNGCFIVSPSARLIRNIVFPTVNKMNLPYLNFPAPLNLLSTIFPENEQVSLMEITKYNKQAGILHVLYGQFMANSAIIFSRIQLSITQLLYHKTFIFMNIQTK